MPLADLSPAFRLAWQQAGEIRRRKTRESAQAAERLWFALVMQALADDRSRVHLPVPALPPGQPGADLHPRLGAGMRGAGGAGDAA